MMYTIEDMMGYDVYNRWIQSRHRQKEAAAYISNMASYYMCYSKRYVYI